VASATTQHRDRVVCVCCVFVSILYEFLCEDYVLLCDNYEFSLIYILLFRLMYTISVVCPIFNGPHLGWQPK
jgi:hypothetical protein